ncbi:tetratricopeptide repeat protein [Alloalcanivorax xenomutans]|uniref:tetratricopeptide repeat protein n=1 Tax=Alloalcanivorax xenomutans TaxID=1094342 RepID=UPI0029344898|nr:tetratricopeptide repeat protein [Alloalcanivorax xenomutans]WOD27544.1 tetratricopeptide repeat protein [Alloalcanivorax xenomutans]
MKPRSPFYAAIPPLIASFLLGGCASPPPRVEDPAATAEPAPPKRPIEYNGTDIGDLLVAETAAQRQALDLTLDYYAPVAERTGDPGVLGQATQLAAYLGHFEQARVLSSQWLRHSPQDPDALRLAALADIQLGDGDAAAAHVDQLVAHHGTEALIPLVAEAQNLDQQGNRELLHALSSLAGRYPEHAPLWYARALERREQGDLEGAMEATDKTLKRNPDHDEALLLKAQLWHDMGQQKRAQRHLRKIVKKAPEQRRYRLAYIRVLLADGEHERAEEQLEILAAQDPDDLDLQYSLALMALESGAAEVAQERLQVLLDQGYRPDEVRMQLAQAAEQQGVPSQAIDLYMQVQGPQTLPARVQAVRLMYERGQTAKGHALMTSLVQQHPAHTSLLYVTEAEIRTDTGDVPGAMALLDEAVGEQPDDPDLLYARAMTATLLKDWDQATGDLRKVLALRPDNTDALNALGYTWADLGINLDQAHDMISQALEQEPDHPAILDSMGWVLFRLGRPQQALEYLQRAYAQFPDAEVAAHLGEVLWNLGQRNKARTVWRDALADDPESELLHGTLQRLGVSL